MTKPPSSRSPRGRPRRSRFTRAAQSAGFLIVVLAAGASGAYLLMPKNQPQSAAVTPHAIPVRTLIARASQSYTVKRSYLGRVVARRTSTIGFERGGLVAKVLVDDGVKVIKGQILAHLNIDKLKNKISQLEAEREEIAAQITSAGLTEQRRKDLLKRGHGSQAAYDIARYKASGLRARKKRIEAAIEALRIDIRKSTLRAPFAGIVAERKVDEGAVVTAGTPVVRLYESGRLEARIGVPVSLIKAVALGSRHSISIDRQPRGGRVTGVSPLINTQTRTVTIILTLDDGPFVPAGQVVRMEIGRRFNERGYWLPLTALSKGMRGLWKVYVLRPTGSAGSSKIYSIARQEIEVLHVETSRVYARGTLRNGDIVVAAGVHKLVPGQRVRSLPAQTSAR